MKRGATIAPTRVTPMSWTFDDVLTATGGTALGGSEEVRFEAIAPDSRHLQSGALFFALRGVRHDGHAFVAAALAGGALAAVVEHPPEGLVAARLIRVADTLRALGDLAAWTRVQQPLRV